MVFCDKNVSLVIPLILALASYNYLSFCNPLQCLQPTAATAAYSVNAQLHTRTATVGKTVPSKITQVFDLEFSTANGQDRALLANKVIAISSIPVSQELTYSIFPHAVYVTGTICQKSSPFLLTYITLNNQ